MIRRPPRSTRTDTLSLHDALPIWPLASTWRHVSARRLNGASHSCICTPKPLANSLMRRSEEHTSELQSLMRISYAVFCLKKKNKQNNRSTNPHKLQTDDKRIKDTTIQSKKHRSYK